jgi:hypothetical protein
MFALTFISTWIAGGIVVFASEIMYRTCGFKLTAVSSFMNRVTSFALEPGFDVLLAPITFLIEP